MRLPVTGLIVAALICGAPAIAQETTGAIVGLVRSGDRQPLPGVSITIDNAETGFRRSVVTGDDGSYRALALRPATYTLTAELDGFKGYRRTVRVDLGSAVTADVTLAIGSFTDVVEVTGAAPLVDTTSTASGITVNAGELSGQVPLARDVTQVALLAPGTFPGNAAFASGSSRRSQLNTPGQSLVTFSGSSINENSYVVNGLNITSLRSMMGSSFVPMEFIQEVQVKTGGYEAEFGRSTGGVVNLVTKSGTNVLHGSTSLYFSPQSLQEQQPNAYDYDTSGNRYVAKFNQNESSKDLEANLSLGGAFVRDTLFFYGFASYRNSRSLELWSTTGQRSSVADPYWGGKLDWIISPSHRVEGTYLSDKVDDRVTGYSLDGTTGAITAALDTGSRFRGGANYIAKYSGSFGDSVLLSAQYGRNEFDRTELPDGADRCPTAYDSRTGRRVRIGCWIDSSVGHDGDARTAYRVDGDWLLGHHSLRAGADLETNRSAREREYSGGVYYRYYLNGTRYKTIPKTTEIVQVQHTLEDGTYETSSNAAYLQDSWAATHDLTVKFGVRLERYRNKNSAGQTFIKVADQLAPRLGVAWDVRGDGREKLYGSFGVYNLPMSTQASLNLGSSQLQDEGWYVLQGGINADGSPGALGQQLAFRITDDGTVKDPRETTDSSFKPMSQSELILGYDRRLSDNWSIGVRGVGRRFNEVIEDILIDKGMWEVYHVPCFDPAILDGTGSCAHDYRLTNPGSDFSGWYDIDGDGVLEEILLTAQQLGIPKAKRNYYAAELTFRRRLADRWMLQGSYTWSHSYGNYEGMVSSDFTQVQPYFTKTFDVAALTEHSWGDLPNDRRHSAKLYGMYSWNSGFQVGSNVWFRTGRPINGFGMHPTDPWAQWYGAKAFYNNGVPCPRGCGGRTADTWNLDLSLRYDFRPWGTNWFIRVDAFNVFNNDTVVEVDEEAQGDTYLPNPNYQGATYYQSPRSVRFGLGMSF